MIDMCSEALERFFNFVEDVSCGEVPLLVAHNGIGFDLRMMFAACQEANRMFPLNYHFLDSLPLARLVLPNKENGGPERHTLVGGLRRVE